MMKPETTSRNTKIVPYSRDNRDGEEKNKCRAELDSENGEKKVMRDTRVKRKREASTQGNQQS